MIGGHESGVVGACFEVFIPIGVVHAPLLEALHTAVFSLRGERAWSAEEFETLLGMEGVFGGIAASTGSDPEAFGFVLARSLVGEAEILTIATRPDQRRKGVGGALLDWSLVEAARRGAEVLFLEVAADNRPARSLYEGRRFLLQGRRKGYYQRGSERIDALVLSRRVMVDTKKT
ncbi:GNAT family N-acetyltransferase [Rhodospirillum sp. A1_3_36]|uniref:GNAT family N-acetyltransferase n=1 Tax=Rhodospirillum sp. A1_3_36 TaxID=3391666 RepID=UPI0039A61351